LFKFTHPHSFQSQAALHGGKFKNSVIYLVNTFDVVRKLISAKIGPRSLIF